VELKQVPLASLSLLQVVALVVAVQVPLCDPLGVLSLGVLVCQDVLEPLIPVWGTAIELEVECQGVMKCQQGWQDAVWTLCRAVVAPALRCAEPVPEVVSLVEALSPGQIERLDVASALDAALVPLAC